MSEQQSHAEAIMQRARNALAATDEALNTAVKSLRDRAVS